MIGQQNVPNVGFFILTILRGCLNNITYHSQSPNLFYAVIQDYAKGVKLTNRQRIILEVDEQDIELIEQHLNKLDTPRFSGTLVISYDPPLPVQR